MEIPTVAEMISAMSNPVAPANYPEESDAMEIETSILIDILKTVTRLEMKVDSLASLDVEASMEQAPTTFSPQLETPGY